MPRDTQAALGADANACKSRSLFFDGFADPAAKEDARKEWFNKVIQKEAEPIKAKSWEKWLRLLPPDNVCFARLQSRLMINMAGGAMENAGLCLDRFGVPYIPGSAVKGCARHLAIQKLVESREANHPVEDIARLLADIARVFGWGDQDWKMDANKDGNYRSDFVYAVGIDLWDQVRQPALQLLNPGMDGNPGSTGSGICAPSAFAGSVSFLPAYPLDADKIKLELDVITCHHQDYYAGTKPIATDDEDPNPVFFIAIAAGAEFGFCIKPLRGERSSLSGAVKKLHLLAIEWLIEGIETFGIGAKTNAGYGWFDAKDSVHEQILSTLENRDNDERIERQRADEEQQEAARIAKEQKARADMKAQLASLSPEAQEDYKISLLTDDQFRSAVDNFLKKEPTEQNAIVRGLRGSRLDYWTKYKDKAIKGNAAKIAESIRAVSKRLNLGKMP